MMGDYGVSALVLATDPEQMPCEVPRFYRAGGEEAPTTTVGAAVRCNAEKELIVSIGFTAENPRYLPVSHGEGLQNPAYQHSVAMQIRPRWDDTTVYYFALAANGAHFGLRYPVVPLADGATPEPVTGYQTRQDMIDGECLNAFIIPWEILGGKPEGPFGLNLLYTRAQSSEYLSPVAMDHTREIAPDLFMEVHFGDESRVVTLDGTLVTLPSGVQRWQRPAVLRWPGDDERRMIAQMAADGEPTTPETLPRRLHLVQRWLDTLMLEGFSFHPEGGCWTVGEGEFRPEGARAAVNEALRRGDMAEACRVVDVFRGQLSRTWEIWSSPELRHPIVELTQIICREREMVLMAVTESLEAVTLHLSSPFQNCLRLHADPSGFFDAPPSVLLEYVPLEGGVDAHFGDLAVEVRKAPFSITVKTGDRIRWRLHAGDLALRTEAVDVTLPLAEDEVIYGFGERFDVLNQRGRVINVHDLDAWEGTIYGLRNQQYKPIQLFHSSTGYSLFLNSTYRLRADVGQGRPDQLRLTQYGPILDCYLWACDPLEAIQGYTELTGRPMLPPKWVFEPWMGGGWGRWKHGPLGDSTAEILNVVARFEELGIPHAAIYAEGEASDDPRLFTALAPKGIRPLAWMNSHMGLKQQRELLPDVPDTELPIVRRANGRTFPYVDFTHPHALELLRAYWQRRLDLGIAGTMVDFGDLVPDDALFHDGRRGDQMHNLYAYDYHRLYRALFEERRGEDHVLFSRSVAPGSQRWLCQFAGDHQANFVGMQAALYGGLNLSACGFSTWGCDIGGYLGWPDPETYIRWVQWGCFSPIMRCHGTEPREPWEFGEDVVPIYAFYAWLRMNLLDYIYAAAMEAHVTGVPMMRALPLAFPGDAQVAACDDQYLFGPDLLVAPVLAGSLHREVRFPAGRWVDFWTGEVVIGPATRMVDTPLERIPLYLRAGACFSAKLNGALAWGASMACDRVRVVVATPPTGGGGFTITVDDAAARYLLVYGLQASAVTVDGRLVPQLTDNARRICPPGWYADETRIVVRLPEGRHRRVEIHAENGHR